MTDYAAVSGGVPADGYHSAFRLRFRSVGTTGAFDDWFVDDVVIDYGPEIATSPGSFNKILQENDSTYSDLVVSNSGQGTLIYSVVVQPVYSKRQELFYQLQERGLTNPASYAVPEELGVLYEQVKGNDEQAPRGPEVVYGAGGPDAFGYVWFDSDELGGPTYSWVDISGSGTNVIGGLDDDNFVGPFPIGFTFPYYEGAYTQFYVSSNGFIGFGPTTDYNSLSNVNLPTAGTPNNAIYWCWDDLNPDDPDNPGGQVRYQTLGSDLVISWIAYPEFNSSTVVGDVITAQVILSSDGTIKVQYQSVGAGFDIMGNTIGTENLGGTDGLQIALNTSYIHGNLAIEISKPAQWSYVEPLAGSVPPGESDTLTVKFTSVDLDTGVYNANIKVYSNDPTPGMSPLSLPTKLTVVPPGQQYLCGDANNDELVTISDAVYLVNFIFSSGPAPDPMAAGDANCDSLVTISDAVYLVLFIFGGGPTPCDACK
jgi:hypothetical protein